MVNNHFLISLSLEIQAYFQVLGRNYRKTSSNFQILCFKLDCTSGKYNVGKLNLVID